MRYKLGFIISLQPFGPSTRFLATVIGTADNGYLFADEACRRLFITDEQLKGMQPRFISGGN